MKQIFVTPKYKTMHFLFIWHPLISLIQRNLANVHVLMSIRHEHALFHQRLMERGETRLQISQIIISVYTWTWTRCKPTRTYCSFMPFLTIYLSKKQIMKLVIASPAIKKNRQSQIIIFIKTIFFAQPTSWNNFFGNNFRQNADK